MKNILLLSFALMMFKVSFSQSVVPAVNFKEDYCKNEEIVVNAKLINTTSERNFRWVRIQKTQSPSWTSAFCDCDLCHTATTDSADFIINAGDSCNISYHYYPNSVKGIGTSKVKIFPVANRSLSTIGEFNASCWGASVNLIQVQTLKIAPNPVANLLNFTSGFEGNTTYEILDINGKVILSSTNETLNVSIDVSGLNNGLYMLKATNGNYISTSRFIKN